MTKGSTQEDIMIIYIYSANIGAPQYIRQMLTTIKGENNSNTIIVGELNTPLTPMDRSSQQKITKETQVLNETQALNDTLDHTDLTDMFRTFHMKEAEYTSFSSTQGNFSSINIHMLQHLIDIRS